MAEEEPPSKKAKADGGEEAAAATSATRVFTVKTLGGDEFHVSLASNSTVADLETEVAKAKGLGFAFTLLGADNKELANILAPLPQGDSLQLVIENTSELPGDAPTILKKPFRKGKVEADTLHSHRLGCNRRLGVFPGHKWKEGGLESAISDFEDNDSQIDGYGAYNVLQMTIVDGDDKHIRLFGVINEGDADCNTGMWGSVYLRPSMQKVADIRSYGDSESLWETTAGFEYKDPSPPLPTGNVEHNRLLTGGASNANTPLKLHLAYALSMHDRYS